MNEAAKKGYETSSVQNGLKVHKGFGMEYVSKMLEGRPIASVTVDEARKILDKSLGNESLYECVRQERDER